MRWKAAAAATTALVACASSTKLTDVQVAPDTQRVRVQNVLVIGLFKDPAARAAYENDMVKALKQAGAQAQASQGLLPIGTVPTRAQIEQLVKEKQFDGAVVGELIDKHTSSYVTSQPVYASPGFYDWYGGASPMLYEPSVSTSTSVVVQTRVFTTATGQAEFAASSQTVDPHDAADVAGAHSELVVGALKKSGLV